MFGECSSSMMCDGDDSPTLASGAVVGGYRVDQRIGAGGLAEVYSAEDLLAARTVALKVLRPKYCAVPEFVERMRREAVLTTQLRHPNIVVCLDSGVDAGRPWLALQRLRGATLRQRLQKEGPLWPHEVLPMMRQAAAGLRAAHRRGIVHRDLKPENLFIERERLVLLDFGFAKPGHHGSITDPFTLAGTIAYMAPEQILRKQPDPRADIYALGICLYEALAGHHPFVNEQGAWPSDDVMAQFHLEDPPCPLTELFDGFPTELCGIVEHCLAKDPNERYPDVAHLATDLWNAERRLTLVSPRERFSDLKELWQSAGQEGDLRSARPSLAPSPPVIIWRNIFVLVDNGCSSVSDYPVLERMVVDQAVKHPAGLGCIVVIPSTARPPPEDVRRAIDAVLDRLGPRLQCVCWVIEGSGFQAAFAQAIILGLRAFGRRPYATHVARDMSCAVSWVLRVLAAGVSPGVEFTTALEAISDGRKSSPPMTAAASD